MLGGFPGAEGIVVGVPSVVMLALWIFRLDAVVALPRSGTDAARHFCEIGETGEPEICDPDGKPAGK